jgi:hypothetical protein
MKEERAGNKTSKMKSDGKKGSSRPSWSNGGGEKARKASNTSKAEDKG